MGDLRIVKGNTFETVIEVKAYRYDGTEWPNFNLDACTNIKVVIHINDSSHPLNTYTIEEGNKLSIRWDNTCKTGKYCLEVTGVLAGDKWRFYDKTPIFTIVNTNAEANIPKNAIIKQDCYQVDSSFIYLGKAAGTGPQGEKGEKGDKGDKGDTGETGPQGPQGIQGEKGEKGDVGPAGPQGPRGESGGKGDKGDAGVNADSLIQAFKWGESDVEYPTPMPTQGEYDNGWEQYATNRTGNQYLWVTQATKYGNGTFSEWNNPVCISGNDGAPGEDAKDREYIYKRVIDINGYGTLPENITDGEVSPSDIAYGSETNKQLDDWVPNGWSDTAISADPVEQYVYVSIRSWDTSTRTWGDFSVPVIWSNWGI